MMTMHQRFRHAVGAGMGRDHLGVLGFTRERGLRRHQSGRDERGDT
ncbi:UNVERIFIED_ORG: hypothetical protein M2179_003985 [Bradyrhizobium japonicum]